MTECKQCGHSLCQDCIDTNKCGACSELVNMQRPSDQIRERAEEMMGPDGYPRHDAFQIALLEYLDQLAGFPKDQ